MDILSLPFNRHIGLCLSQRGENKVVCLEPEPIHRNHLGTVHASALYALAEAASGYELLNRADLDPRETMAVLRSAKVKYRRPAQHRLLAFASVTELANASFHQQFAEKGRGFLDVQVRIVAGGDEEEVFAGDFTWFVSRSN